VNEIILQLLSGLVGALLVAIPVWYKIVSERKKIDAETNMIKSETDENFVSIATGLLKPLQERITTLESDMEKKIAEAYMVTRERDEQRLRIEKLECMVRTVIESFRAFIGTPKNAKETEALRLLKEMEAEL
jgi:hypothetical protein